MTRKIEFRGFFYQNMASSLRASEKMNISPCSSSRVPLRPSGPAAGTSPLLTSKVLLSRSSYSSAAQIISRWPCPRVRPRRHATQRARSEIFKLSLLSSSRAGGAAGGLSEQPASARQCQ